MAVEALWWCMRLNRLLARVGVASRRQADELIRSGAVTVNDAPGTLGMVVQPQGGREGERDGGSAAPRWQR